MGDADSRDRPGGRVGRRRLAAAAWIVGAAVVAVGGGLLYDRMTHRADLCDALLAEVPDAPAVPISGGGTVAPTWSAVLTDGVWAVRPTGPPPSGVPIAVTLDHVDLSRAVHRDPEGYAEVRRLLPIPSRPVADRQRTRLLDPLAINDGDVSDVVADTEHLARLATTRCGSV